MLLYFHGMKVFGGDYMNLLKLKGKVREAGSTYKKCAEAIGISTTSFNKKINGYTKFYIDELDELGNFLGMSDVEKADIFLR